MDYEQKYNNIINALQSLIANGKKQGHIIIRIEDVENAIPELKELEGEKKSVYKAESKFHEGDWIRLDTCVSQIKSIKDEGYYFDDGFAFSTEFVDKYYHLWTINDAKEGDVLASKDGYEILIFKKLDSHTCFSSYYNINRRKEIGWYNRSFIPATKEQRNTLFGKMREEGYKWDAEKKELKKIGLHIGDWITFYGGTPFKIVKIEQELNGTLDYLLVQQDGHDSYFNKKYVDENAILWTIHDAKPGDVLVDVYGNTGIFQKNNDFDWTSYCSLGVNGGFQNFQVEHENDKTKPATEEQRDNLMKAVAKAGCVWDDEKKHLYMIIP